jgi:hypothetical protein
MEPEPKPVCDRLVAFEVAPVFQRDLAGAGLLSLEGEHDMAAGTDGAAWVVRLRSNRESVIRRSSMIKRRVTPTPDDAALNQPATLSCSGHLLTAAISVTECTN